MNFLQLKVGHILYVSGIVLIFLTASQIYTLIRSAMVQGTELEALLEAEQEAVAEWRAGSSGTDLAIPLGRRPRQDSIHTLGS